MMVNGHFLTSFSILLFCICKTHLLEDLKHILLKCFPKYEKTLSGD